MNKKALFKQIFAATAILLAILPGLVTFSAILTEVFNKMGWYVWLQELVVPFQSKLVAVLVKTVGIKALVTGKVNYSIVVAKPDGSVLPVALEWNCLGWQSMILLAITFFSGLRGNFTAISRIETITIGVIGTFLTNLLRMAFIVSLAYYWNAFAALIVHDYFASFVALIWIIFFWWFSYTYVLEDIETKFQENKGKV